jgi:energy-coupling factor transporter transmembrane protein EcfT
MNELKIRFPSQRGTLFIITVFATCLLILGSAVLGLVTGELNGHLLWILLPLIMVVFFLLWIFFETGYELTNSELKYKSGPFKGSVGINRINEIIEGSTSFIGFKPATAQKGLIIKYDQFKEIYISPKTNKEFLTEIKQLNQEIKIIPNQ